MPVELPMKFSRSFRLVFEKRRLSGSFDVGLSAGSAALRRASSRIASIAGRGRLASSRSRSSRSSSPARAATERFDGSYSLACRYSRSASSGRPSASNARPRATWKVAAACIARSSAILYSGLSGAPWSACR